MSAFKNLSQLLKKTLQLKKGTHVYLLRHAQSMGDHTGSMIGWTDSRLSIKGRQQANSLFRGFYEHVGAFTDIHTSNLSRCKETLSLCLGFPNRKFIESPDLRQLNFGDDQGIHFDSLPPEQKQIINSLDYKAPNGQTWAEARSRAIKYLTSLKQGHHLISTHGGLMCALTHPLGITEVYPNCSVIAAQICPQKKDLLKIHFGWRFPQE